MAEGRTGQVPELTALDQNMSSITAQIGSANIQWFSNKLVKNAFTDRGTAQGIVTTNEPVANKVGRLMDHVYGAIMNASNKREKYDSFVDIFSHNAAYSDLAHKLNNSIHATELRELEIKLREKEAELRVAKDELQHPIPIKNNTIQRQKLKLIIPLSAFLTIFITLLLQFYINCEFESKEMCKELQMKLRKDSKKLEEQIILTQNCKMEILMQNEFLLDYVLNYPKVSGPGLTSATVNHRTHVLVEITDSNGRPFPLQMNVTAQLEPFPKFTPADQPTTTSLPVVMKSPSQYEMSYTAVSRGQHKLHVHVNDRKINGSPFRVMVYPDPRQLDHPVRKVTDLNKPWGIAFNNHEQMIVSQNGGNNVYIFKVRGRIRTFGSEGDRPDQIRWPRGVAADADFIYVSSDHKLQKFTNNGELIKCIGQKGNKEGEFSGPCGITVYNNQLYVCDTRNHHIQVFDLDLNFVRSIGSHGKGRSEFDGPHDVKFDTAGNMYIAEWGNSRVQVLDSSGVFIRSLGQEEGKGKLSRPIGLHIADKYVYVSDYSSDCIIVYETSGQFVTLFGRPGSNDGEFNKPCSITSDVDGFIYVCDSYNNRVQIF